MSFEFDASEFFFRLDEIENLLLKTAERSMTDSVEDLARIASQIAPIDTSTLRKSVKTKVTWKSGKLQGEVWFYAVERSPKYGRFNYALWTHEYMGDSQLGPLSSGAGGTDGYTVGSKYLERPLKGESSKYLVEWMAKELRKVLGS
ncbi:HK97 gp10 family phage protein [Sutcliffiella horikoshii]|uniref:HK97 gp10 family phage protein n=1 Tax=Sutcliffiella horikoshii TaxID=79883 RepID=A0A5D4SA07_9BACI|nr:HK97 gp10 family phage protein [Sutcliffiella horikoshii]TYS60475.1 HK97 gp10 family phage protein [Sutcliffiella horikoshii]